MANNPLGTQGFPAVGNQDIPAIGTQGFPAIGNQDIPAIGNQDISDQNVINNILRHLLIMNFFDLQHTNATLTGQNPASSHLQAPVSNDFLASCRASMNDQLEQFRNTAIRDLWHDVPHTVGVQMLFQMKLIDTNPRFIIPVQMALSFFPSPVAHYYEYLTVTGRDSLRWQMRYAYNSGTHNFEIISEWDTFLEHYSIRIGDYVSFSMNRRGDIFVVPTKREPTLLALF